MNLTFHTNSKYLVEEHEIAVFKVLRGKGRKSVENK